MIDLHTHSLFSDGVLLPSELVRRAEDKGFSAIAITDHIDISNIDYVIPQIVKACDELNKYLGIFAIPGAEITHVPPETIKNLAQTAKELGAKLIVVHGETICEPVKKGTNMAAVMSEIDILAHPGLITEDEARIAGERSIYLEITGRRGHSLTNGHVASIALKTGARLIFNTDAHEPGDLMDTEEALRIVAGAGIQGDEAKKVFSGSKKIVDRIRNRRGG